MHLCQVIKSLNIYSNFKLGSILKNSEFEFLEVYCNLHIYRLFYYCVDTLQYFMFISGRRFVHCSDDADCAGFPCHGHPNGPVPFCNRFVVPHLCDCKGHDHGHHHHK